MESIFEIISVLLIGTTLSLICALKYDKDFQKLINKIKKLISSELSLGKKLALVKEILFKYYL